ncbi:hypothetical protein BKA70DRAFT_1405443 [Coprinopsis sp. MPI-PUGE-AT-0042]|nr:hypothetical protein BKA70DRAFT_1405443 [Coprinopsis sp. MPI-PUGE-AT-0042]
MALQRNEDASQNSVFYGSNNFKVKGGEYLYALRDVSKVHDYSYRYYQINLLVIHINSSLDYICPIGLRLSFIWFLVLAGAGVLYIIWLPVIICATLARDGRSVDALSSPLPLLLPRFLGFGLDPWMHTWPHVRKNWGFIEEREGEGTKLNIS